MTFTLAGLFTQGEGGKSRLGMGQGWRFRRRGLGRFVKDRVVMQRPGAFGDRAPKLLLLGAQGAAAAHGRQPPSSIA